MDDLGWNDMGQMVEPEADIHPLHDEDEIDPPPEGVPPVLAQRRQLKEEFEPPVIDAVADEHDVTVEAPRARARGGRLDRPPSGFGRDRRPAGARNAAQEQGGVHAAPR